MTDNCPRCGRKAAATPRGRQVRARYRCPRGHTWTTSYDRAAYGLTDDTPPAHWTTALADTEETR
ncbi:hypothetical protein [Streptomyces aidingensis]|uniref:Uncharacterized protein n=1 Tax=Streptomyces aidingensis TaxID=910347 RepID=A0A1I1PTW1_9ACTN|nr:hypothetical protein [Streptomyces aidingensis]SFD13374.1 hypothetical protein SAMN05421773_11055 [Streptomyces aidingensis]